MELLPPVGWAVATKQDLDAVGHPVGAQMCESGFEMADLRAEMATGLVWAVVTPLAQ